MKTKTCLTLAIVLLTVAAHAREKQRQWQKGTLKDVASDHVSRAHGSYSGGSRVGNTSTAHGSLTQIPITLMNYVIQTDDYEFVGQRDMTPRDSPLLVTVNDSVTFAIEGTDLYLKDEKGKEHKLMLMKKTKREKPTQGQ